MHNTDEKLIECDLIIVAVGQGIESRAFEEFGVKITHGVIEALDTQARLRTLREYLQVVTV